MRFANPMPVTGIKNHGHWWTAQHLGELKRLHAIDRGCMQVIACILLPRVAPGATAKITVSLDVGVSPFHLVDRLGSDFRHFCVDIALLMTLWDRMGDIFLDGSVPECYDLVDHDLGLQQLHDLVVVAIGAFLFLVWSGSNVLHACQRGLHVGV